MAGQEQERRSTSRREPDEEPSAEPAPVGAARQRTQEQDEDLDALLEEIDGVLETNAEEFVHGFVQKGGQ